MARVTLACAMSFVVVVVHGPRRRRACCTGSASAPPDVRRSTCPGGSRWPASCWRCRWSSSASSSSASTAVTVAQSTKRAQRGRGPPRAGVAETLANSRALRDAVDRGTLAYIRVAAETTRINSGSASVVVARPDRDGPRQRRPRRAATGATTSATARSCDGRGWVGERTGQRRPRGGGDGADPHRPAAASRRVRRGHPALPDGAGRRCRRGAEPARPTWGWPARSASSARCWWPAG